MAPLLLVFAGLPGTGKSTIAQPVALQLDAAWLRVDTAEAAILRAGLSQSFETGLAGYCCVQDIAADQLRLGRNVVVDAVNGVEPAREMWRTLAREYSARLVFIQVVCSDSEEHRKRVESRTAATPPLPLPTWQEVLQREYQPWSEPVLTVDSFAGLDEIVARILHYVSG